MINWDSSTFVNKGVVTNYSGTAPCGEFPPEVDRSFYLKYKQLHDTNTIYGNTNTFTQRGAVANYYGTAPADDVPTKVKKNLYFKHKRLDEVTDPSKTFVRQGVEVNFSETSNPRDIPPEYSVSDLKYNMITESSSIVQPVSKL